MKVYEPKDIRNIAVVGHGGEGKTTLCEAMLFNSGAIDRMGRVEDGNTVTDYDQEEAKRHISIGLGLAPVEWKKCKINLLDAPGFFDFESEATAAYHLADCGLIVMSCFGNVPVGAQKAYDKCGELGKSRAFLINQIDKEHTDFDATVEALSQKYSPAATVVQYPVLEGGKYVGVVDIVGLKAYRFDGKNVKEEAVPSALESRVEELRETLIENAAGNDEELMEKFFDGQELSKDDILKGLRAGICEGSIAPVFVTAASANLGVTVLMDAIVDLFPSGAEAKPVSAKKKDGGEAEIKADASAPFAAQVVKTIADPFVGKLSIIKVYAGTLTSDMSVLNMRTGKSEKCSNLGVMRGKTQISLEKVYAGDIAAIAKLQNTVTSDTLCAQNDAVEFEPIVFGKPCIALAVDVVKQGEEEKVYGGLHRLEEEDPTFKLEKHLETGDMLARGMGELHLEVICRKLKNKFKVEAVLKDPRVPYRETIKKAVKAQGRHKKQSGGHGQFGDVWIEFAPTFGEEDFVFEDKIVGGVVPKQYIPAVEKGLRESITRGVLAGYPMVGIKCTLYDGSYHSVDSSEMAFKVAANLAYKKGVADANPVLLEPICKAEVLVPDECMGDIIGDMNRRRGRILGMNPQGGGLQKVEAEVPMSEMTKYATDLRSMTQGRGVFDLTFERYEELPSQMAAKVIEQAKKDAEEEK